MPSQSIARIESDVLPAYRHGAHVARRAEPGADDRAGPAGARAPHDARRALRRRASAAREGRARPSAARAEDGNGSDGRVAPVAHHQTAEARRRARARSARRRDGGAGAVDEHPAREAAARGRTAGGFSPARQLAVAMEIPAGGLLHLRLGGYPRDARRRRGARGPRRSPSTKASISDASRPPRRRTSTRISGCRTRRRSSATWPRSCRTRDNAI